MCSTCADVPLRAFAYAITCMRLPWDTAHKCVPVDLGVVLGGAHAWRASAGGGGGNLVDTCQQQWQEGRVRACHPDGNLRNREYCLVLQLNLPRPQDSHQARWHPLPHSSHM